MRLLLTFAAIPLACVPFAPNESSAVKREIRSNLEVVAAPECLGKLVAILPTAVLPEPQGHISKMEFGPLEPDPKLS